jgi:hypothetical protein
MDSIPLLPGTSPVWLIVLAGFVSMAAVGVGVYRKWKSGEIEDIGTLNSRLETDNVNLRALNALRLQELEDERIKRRHAEDVAAVWYRQLLEEGFEPREVK